MGKDPDRIKISETRNAGGSLGVSSPRPTAGSGEPATEAVARITDTPANTKPNPVQNLGIKDVPAEDSYPVADTTTKAMDDKAEDSRMAWEVGRTEGVTFERARIRHELESLTHYYWLDDVKCYRVSDVLDVIGGKDA